MATADTNTGAELLPPLSGSQTAWESVKLDSTPSLRTWITMKTDDGKQPKNTTRAKNPLYFNGIYQAKYVLESSPESVYTGSTCSTASQHGGLRVVLAENSSNQPFTDMIGECSSSKIPLQIAIVDQSEQNQSTSGYGIYGRVTHYGHIHGPNMKACFFRLNILGHVGLSRPLTLTPGQVPKIGGTSIGATYNFLDQGQAGTPLTDTSLKNLVTAALTALTILKMA